MRISNGWYQGTADAVYQNIYSLRIDQPKYVLILSGDQIYRMDYGQLLIYHKEKEAELTVTAIETDRETAQRSGVLTIDHEHRIVDFEEKPENPKPLSPNQPEKFLVSMGVYVFNSKRLVEELEKDVVDEESEHDFGKNIIPRMKTKRAFVYLFRDSETGQPDYWRDVGTIESYFEANMDLVGIRPKFNLYDKEWSWRTLGRTLPPAKIVFRANLDESIIGEGCIIDEGEVIHSILSPRVKVGKDVQIISSVVMDDVEVKDGSRIVRTIIDKENIIPPYSNVEVGNISYVTKYETTPSGIVVIPRRHTKWRGY